MPEGAETSVLFYQMKRWRDMEIRRTKKVPQATIKFFPRMFGEGTSRKDWTPITVNRSQYSPEVEPTSEAFIPNAYDLASAKREGCVYLVDRPLLPGPFLIARRGKGLLIAAGHHAVTINLGLEAHIIGMKQEDFDEIVAVDQPGPNGNKAKSKRLRSFPLPARFIDPGTYEVSRERRINIFVAFVSNGWVWAVVDFSRIVRLHVTSRSLPWAAEDIMVGSPAWPTFWKPFPDGPDWILERTEAEQALDAWREKVLTSRSTKAIVAVISGNDSCAFGGFGRHLANDFLYTICIFPGTPIIRICEDETVYQQLKTAIPKYMEHWTSPVFLKRCGSRPNSTNPFSFNITANRNYIGSSMQVFRRREVRVSRDLYNEYQKKGLLDPQHVIDEDYPKDKWALTSADFKIVQVYLRNDPLNAFTIIRAQCPAGWKDGSETEAQDMEDDGFKTTIGPAQFHELKRNMLNANTSKGMIRRGRRATIKTGLRGRPTKTHTKTSLRRALPFTKKTKKTKAAANDTEDAMTDSTGIVVEFKGYRTRQKTAERKPEACMTSDGKENENPEMERHKPTSRRKLDDLDPNLGDSSSKKPKRARTRM